MQFRCERDVLVDALKAASRAVGRRGGAMMSLGCLRLHLEGDTLTVEGTDLEIAIAATVLVAGQDDGAICVPARILTDTVSALPAGAVTMEARPLDASVAITGGRSSFELRVVDEAEFPRLEWPDGEAPELPAKELLAAMGRVVPAASTDDSRPILCGVLMERRDDKMRLVATDSYRLMWEDLDHGAALGTVDRALVPADALATLAKVATKADMVAMHLGERSVAFAVGDELRVSARLIEGDFPKYEGLIPQAPVGTLSTNREELVEVVKRAKILARESTPVRFTLAQADNLLGAITQDVGSATVAFDAGYEGPDMVVAFNPDYLLDALEAAPGDTINLAVTDGRNPAKLTVPGADQFLAILMPVRVS